MLSNKKKIWCRDFSKKDASRLLENAEALLRAYSYNEDIQSIESRKNMASRYFELHCDRRRHRSGGN